MREISVAMVVLAIGWTHSAALCVAAEETPDETGPTQAAVEKILSKTAVVPDGVVYKKATVEDNRKAIAKLSKTFLAEEAKELPDDLFTGALIGGAGMWQNIKDDAEMKTLEGARATIRVPTPKGKQEMEGKVFLDKKELASFWRAFRRKYKLDSKAIVRRPTSDDLSLYWAMIPFDITEPVFIIESTDAIILVHFTEKDLQIAWIDDFKNLIFEKAK